ncbi:MAG: SIMPL domain-containing protein [Chryseobacterium sp.]|nr:MAG: SIMPL domain-containing protein [Chryseobacterium sp.]
MRNYITAAIIAVGAIIAAAIFGNAIKNRNSAENTISVTGLGTKTFESDLISWNGSFSRNNYDLKEAYDLLAADRRIISEYLKARGIKAEETVFSAVEMNKQFRSFTDQNGNYQQGEFAGYNLTQSVSVQSKDVARVENTSRTVTEIINRGVEFTSSPPLYFYTKLADIKHQMIADATQDAKKRAEEIAKNSGARLGDLKKATMGVVQITAPNSAEEYSWGGAFNTSSKEKEASITIKLEYLAR